MFAGNAGPPHFLSGGRGRNGAQRMPDRLKNGIFILPDLENAANPC